MQILNCSIGRNASVQASAVNNNNVFKSFIPKLKTLDKDTVTFSGVTKQQNAFLNTTDISALTNTFAQKLNALKESGNLSLESAQALIKAILPAQNVKVLPIDAINNDLPHIGDPGEQAIFGVFNPVLENKNAMKFNIYYDLSNNTDDKNKDVKNIAQVHEFVHLLQANTEHNYKTTLKALKEPSMVVDSYQQMNGIFHAIEYNLYMNNNLPEENYIPLIKGYVDNYFSMSDTPPVLKFAMMSAYNEAQAHYESLNALMKMNEMSTLPEQSVYKTVYDTIPVYTNLANATLTMLKDRDKFLKDYDREFIDFYEKQLSALKKDYSELKV
ncbi:MAG: hypothetical protein AB7V50_03225 [Vampirovibrionia bacterium]